MSIDKEFLQVKLVGYRYLLAAFGSPSLFV